MDDCGIGSRQRLLEHLATEADGAIAAGNLVKARQLIQLLYETFDAQQQTYRFVITRENLLA